METDVTKAYITEAFRLYARLGYPCREKAQEITRGKEAEPGKSVPPDRARAQAKKPAENKAPLLLDLLAVESTLSLLRNEKKEDVIAAVTAVYFVNPSAPLRRGDISDRVRRFAMTCPADERTVYRWLKYARLLCAAKRGLRIPDADKRKYRLT